jgi:flagellin
MEITMAIIINSTSGFVFGASAAKSDRNFMENHSERLSSGKRINSAADDSAGLAVLSRLEAALSEKETAIRNAVDGQGALSTADAGATEVTNILNRMRELAVQAANGTNSIAQREAIQSEADQLTAEISRIADNTSFNGKDLLTGGQIDVQIGSASNERLMVEVGELTSSALNIDGETVSFDTSSNAQEALQVIDAALEKVNTARNEIGGGANRISSAISSLTDTAKTSAIAAGRVADANIGEESKNLAKGQILQQSSIAMLAQENASKRAILQLM